ncbi:MAG: PAS domain-containing protein [Verrucomicrobia bacterium]|nr:PAS domain-containing protein [Verrucomicrobiota bacterium]
MLFSVTRQNRYVIPGILLTGLAVSLTGYWFLSDPNTDHGLASVITCIASLVITLLLAALVRELLHRAELVENAVVRRTTKLQEIQNKLEGDIRRRENIETLLRTSEQQLHGLMENSPGAIYVKDVDGRYLAVNRRFAELHGRPREEFIGRNDFDLFPPELAARVRKTDAQVMAGAEPLEVEESFQLVDGTHINLVHKFPLIDPTGAVHGVGAIATDITERKHAEAEVRESRRQLESLLGQLPGMAFRFSNDGKLTPVYVSRGAAGLTGHTARDFLEKHISLDEIIHPDDRQRVRTTIATAVKKRRSFEVEYRLTDRANREKWVLERGQGIHDDTGALLFIEGLAIDITQRKDAESEKLLVERRLLEGQKLESIGVLAGGIAHDFNNLLTGIIGNANLASLDLPPVSPIRNNLKQIELASQRAAELCQQMLAYAGKGRFVIQAVELGALVKTTVPLLQSTISKRAKLRFDLQPALPAVMSDPTQLRQIIMNLVLNASEALNERDGEIAISTNLVRPAADWFDGAALSPPEMNMEFVRLEVRDSGCGMTPETIAKIFEPFYTTKFTGRGLGLAAVLGIIRSHRGGLIVRSVVGKGSVFALFFPADSALPVNPSPIRSVTITPWKRAGRVLVVDDEPHVLKVAASMLSNAGMTVETANDGYEALDFFRAKPESFDLVVLDMTMPRLSGEETLYLLREIRPGVRVLFMSGYNRREVVDALPGRATLGFMQKPFTLQALRENLQYMLG